jgi:hypothetical protein
MVRKVEAHKIKKKVVRRNEDRRKMHNYLMKRRDTKFLASFPNNRHLVGLPVTNMRAACNSVGHILTEPTVLLVFRYDKHFLLAFSSWETMFVRTLGVP